MHESKPEGIDGPSNDERLEAVHQALSVIAINQLRLYDVLMGIYGEKNHEDAVELANLHKQGHIRGEIPWLEQ